MLSVAIKKAEKWGILLPLLPMLYVSYIFYSLREYIQVSWWHLLAIAAYVFISRIHAEKKVNYFLLVCSGLFLYLFYAYQTTSFLFISAILLLVETINAFVGRMNINAHFLLIICSPVFKYAITVFGFPLRLKLSSMAAYLLSFLVENIETSGNLILVNGHEFAVDEACAGLNMLSTSFIFTLLLIEIMRRQTRNEISFWSMCFIYKWMLTLNLLSNLLRICTLTILKIYPDDPFHEYVGILCFALYNLLPVYYVVKYTFSYWGKEPVIKTDKTRTNLWAKALLVTIAFAGIFVANGNQVASDPSKIATLKFSGTQEFEKETLDHNIVKYYSGNALVYVKPLGYFYSTEHNPLFCWKGSGYQMQQFDLKKAGGHDVYMGKLLKDGKVLYSAWYYTDGQTHTASQWEWRWHSIKEKKPFYLVNASAVTEKELYMLLEKLSE